MYKHKEPPIPVLPYHSGLEMPIESKMPPCADMPYEPKIPPYEPERPCEPEIPHCHEVHVYPSSPPLGPCNPHANACSAAMMDYGPNPFFVDICHASLQNNNFRTTLWTGNNLQLTLMCIPPCEEIGLELHPVADQFICITEGEGMTLMGDAKDHLFDQHIVACNCAVFIPCGTWHNIINTGNVPLRLYSIYAPPLHARGSIHMRREEAIAAEG